MTSSNSTILPLFSSPQKIQSTSQPFNQRLEGHNYLPWSVQFQVFLRIHDLNGMIDGSEEPPTKTLPDDSSNPAYAIWF
jgi:hypothetical protein